MEGEVVVVQLLSHVQLLQSHGLQPARLLCPWDFPGKNFGVGNTFFLEGIFPTQGSNLHLLHGRWILYCRATREAQGRDEAQFKGQTFACVFLKSLKRGEGLKLMEGGSKTYFMGESTMWKAVDTGKSFGDKRISVPVLDMLSAGYNCKLVTYLSQPQVLHL